MQASVSDDDGGASAEGSGSDIDERSGDEAGDDADRRRSGSGTDAAARARRSNAGMQNPLEAGTEVRQRTKVKRRHRKGHGIGVLSTDFRFCMIHIPVHHSVYLHDSLAILEHSDSIINLWCQFTVF